jgi:hypothetical protein
MAGKSKVVLKTHFIEKSKGSHTLRSSRHYWFIVCSLCKEFIQQYVYERRFSVCFPTAQIYGRNKKKIFCEFHS